MKQGAWFNFASLCYASSFEALPGNFVLENTVDKYAAQEDISVHYYEACFLIDFHRLQNAIYATH